METLGTQVLKSSTWSFQDLGCRVWAVGLRAEAFAVGTCRLQD